MANMRQYAQIVKEGVWAFPCTKTGNAWGSVKNLNTLKKDETRGYVMGIQKIRNIAAKAGWTVKMSSVKIEGGLRYHLVCTRNK